ncbi:haloacid dehalogenase [Coniella lustricola]|uniref:Haloacid dehalogenase n=1 Tax=Coniella lustricola TaxID=2025994 RepID=A0A2T3AAZ7_9PEZI|nr:haloacid dehalogenase [Coniella lustricola]
MVSSSSPGLAALKDIKALTFDVFGTVVDWRSSVEDDLKAVFQATTAAPPFESLPADLQCRARELTDADWAVFAQQWRNAYIHFTRTFKAGETPWKDIDTHHRESLVKLLDQWKLNGLYTSRQIDELTLVWHRLRPWSDSANGIHALNELGLVTVTLSNGNRSLLTDLNSFGDLGFQKLVSAEDFQTYKPDPKTYLGAAEAIGVKPTEVAMVAAHLQDLDAARKLGLKTIYIERPQEEAWPKDGENYLTAKQWVNLWVRASEDGLVEVAHSLGNVL